MISNDAILQPNMQRSLHTRPMHRKIIPGDRRADFRKICRNVVR
jgi:hypothetical protein